MNRRILLVEDDNAIREALSEVLGEMGYDVMSAPDGLKGLSLAGEQAEPCPILLDWRMPLVDGPEFLARLRRMPRGGEFPVILASGDHAATRDGFGEGVTMILPKPFELAALVAALDRVAPGPA